MSCRYPINAGLQLAMFCEGIDFFATNDEMIEHPDVYERQRLLQGLRQAMICSAGFGDA